MPVDPHPALEETLRAARAARENAYAPYSDFRMGAAVADGAGRVAPGALVENISFGLAMCAERAALFGGVARGHGAPELLVLVAPRTGEPLTWPCGACLQVALELGGPDLLIVACDPDGAQAQARLGDLGPRLPYKGGRRDEGERRGEGERRDEGERRGECERDAS